MPTIEPQPGDRIYFRTDGSMVIRPPTRWERFMDRHYRLMGVLFFPLRLAYVLYWAVRRRLP
jgi:hypothetical protein